MPMNAQFARSFLEPLVVFLHPPSSPVRSRSFRLPSASHGCPFNSRIAARRRALCASLNSSETARRRGKFSKKLSTSLKRAPAGSREFCFPLALPALPAACREIFCVSFRVIEFNAERERKKVQRRCEEDASKGA